MKYLAKLLILIIVSNYSNAQLTDYKKNIAVLSSEDYYGRGYVNKGELKAANFIAKAFEKIKLQKYNENYFQNFSTPINTFPSAIELKINNKKKLTSGKDFLIAPYSSSLKGEFEVVTISFKELTNQNILIEALKKSQGQILAFKKDAEDLSKEITKEANDIIDFLVFNKEIDLAACLILSDEKLTWGTSTYLSARPKITIKSTEKITSLKINLNNKFYENYPTQNVIGFVKGKEKDSTVVLTAHYDHLGMLGEAIFPGANDNASGVALLLEIATYFSSQNKQPKYNMVFIAFGGEEAGLLGSKYYTEHPLTPLKNIKFLLNFDLAGTGDDGIKVVNATVFKKEFEQLQAINKQQNLLPNIQSRGAACNSDHCFFYEKNVPGFYSYTLGGIKAYHDIYDKSETLPLTAFENYAKLIIAFVEKL